jgi:hypothetical protein
MIFLLTFSKNVIKELAALPFPYSMQLDETTDISQCSQLLAFLHYVHADTINKEFFILWVSLETTKTTDILIMVNFFFCQAKL